MGVLLKPNSTSSAKTKRREGGGGEKVEYTYLTNYLLRDYSVQRERQLKRRVALNSLFLWGGGGGKIFLENCKKERNRNEKEEKHLLPRGGEVGNKMCCLHQQVYALAISGKNKKVKKRGNYT